ncbi:MAG: hypothetical protein K2X27_03145 [Candidatus Obscuribacterales bacterium]|nr:hypothetical protein [Candidatus Obscuribacterales bacterium]
MRNAKSLSLAAALASGLFLVGGTAWADGSRQCQLLTTPNPALFSLLKAKKSPSEIVTQLLDPVAPLSSEDMQKIYEQVFEFIAASYIDESKLVRLEPYKHKYDSKLNSRDDLDRALADLIGSMDDRWTWVISAQDQVFQIVQMISKQVSFGLALRLEKDGSFSVEHISFGSGAQLSGFREGDTVIAIDDKPLLGMSKPAAEKLMSGSLGKNIKIKSIQDGKTVEGSYQLKAPVENAPDAKILENNYAYLKLPNFTDHKAFEAVVGAMAGMANGVPGGLSGMVLDLRYNGGGEVNLAKTLISLLTPEGIAITESMREGRMRVDSSTTVLPVGEFAKLKFDDEELAALRELQKLPLVILVNGSSASAAEIVTGALKESRPHTTVIGEQTFGKFVEMSVIELPNCSKVAVTSGRYTTPSGKWLQHVGITPDITIHQPRDSQDDAQMAAALSLLKKQSENSPAQIAQSAPENQPMLGTLPEREKPSLKSGWQIFLSNNYSLLIKGAVGLVLLSFFALYLFVSRKRKD